MSVVIDSDNNNIDIVQEPINVTISTGGADVSAVWGNISGDLTEQEDLQSALDGKVDENAAITGATKTKITYDAKGLVTAGADAGISDITGLQTALDGKVPYTGATQDVNLGEYGAQLGNLEFDTTPTNAPTGAGSVYWNDTDGTLNLILKGGQVISKIGETQHIRALNNTGVQIARGKVVYVTGAQGQRLTVALADADTELLSKDTIGITAEAINDGAEGFVIVQGVISNVNTNGMADGSTVFLSQTAGSYTTTAPIDPAHLVILGFIVNGNSGGAGSIYIKVDNGYELGELHDVNTTGATNGQVLTYDGSIWTAEDPASGGITSIGTTAPITGGTITTTGTIGITQAGAAADGYLSSTDWNTFNNKQNTLTNPVTGTGASGQVGYFNGTSSLTGSNSLFWDNANGRLGIGTNAPAEKLTIQTTTSNATTNIIHAYSNSGALTAFRVTDLGNGIFRGYSSIGPIATNGYGAVGSNYYMDGGSTRRTVADSVSAIEFAVGGFRFLTAGNGAANSLISFTTVATIAQGGDMGLGISTTTPSARLHVRGSGTTSSTTALLVQNSTPTALLQIYDNGRIDQTIPSSTNTTIFGTAAGSASLTGSGNTFIGTSAGNATTTGANNSAFGFSSGLATTTGSNNVFFGSSAGRGNVDGSRNIFIGNSAGRYITDGTTANTKPDDSVFIGTDTKALGNNQTNQIVIGYQAVGIGSNTVVLGNTSITGTYLRGNINYTDGGNFAFGTTTGTKIGTATSEKLSFWNATPIVQPTTAVAAATLVSNGGTALTDTDTFDGYTLAQIVKALRNAGLLA